MIVKQKNLWEKTIFDFREDALYYLFKNGQATREFSTLYEEIQLSDPVKKERVVNWTRTAIGYVACTAYIARLIYKTDTFYPVATIGIITALTSALQAVFLYYYMHSGFTYFSCPKGKIYVFKDKRHDVIMAELNTRSKAQLKARYGKVDIRNSSDGELARFKRLRDLGIIDGEDYVAAFEKIKAASASTAWPSMPTTRRRQRRRNIGGCW